MLCNTAPVCTHTDMPAPVHYTNVWLLHRVALVFVKGGSLLQSPFMSEENNGAHAGGSIRLHAAACWKNGVIRRRSVVTQHTGRRADEFDDAVCATMLSLVDCVMSLPLFKGAVCSLTTPSAAVALSGRCRGESFSGVCRRCGSEVKELRFTVASELSRRVRTVWVWAVYRAFFFFRSLFNLVLICKWGVLAKVLAVNKSPEMVFVVLFVSLSAIYRVGLSGSIAVLICFQSSSSAPFLKSKIDMFSAAVPPPLCFSSVWDWGWSIAETCFTSCCAAYNYRAPRISSEDYS